MAPQRTLPITSNQANKLILKGLHDAWVNVLWATDERSEFIKPEYLSSAAIHRAFAKFANKKGLSGQLIVRCEEATRLLTQKAEVERRMSEWSRGGIDRDESIEDGRVDLGLFQGGGPERAFGVVEIKGQLSFTLEGNVYATSMSELQKDLTRNAKYLKQTGLEHGVIYSAFGFFLYDQESITQKERDRFCKDKKRCLAKTAQNIVSHHRDITVRVKVRTVDYESPEQPGHGSKGPMEENDSLLELWHTACGVISMSTTHML